jgi:hypothetical protein
MAPYQHPQEYGIRLGVDLVITAREATVVTM